TSTPTPTPTPTVTPTPTPALAVVTGTGGRGLRLRWQPGGPVAGVLAEGAQVELLGRSQEVEGELWVQVRDDQGRIGWVVARYLSPLGGD
ncbi:MAG: SH3 domain-containing protein, partial [Chloroflexi bacterium]